MPQLNEYKRKRDFRKTPEPGGDSDTSPSKSGRHFVIHKHDASRLHYDLRLEHEGVLLSWAVPKGPSLVPGDKRLAVHVEDHPLDYGSFEGTIPEDEYGGGTVMVWDQGDWEPTKDPAEGLERGRLEFELHGNKLNGAWLLTRMGQRNKGDKKNWLLIKRRDNAARGRKQPDILDERPESIATGRSLEEIAESGDHPRRPDRSSRRSGPKKPDDKKSKRGKQRKSQGADIEPAKLTRAKKSALPKDIRPQLATLVKQVPKGDQWLHEIKFDGYRILCRIDKDKIRLLTRNGKDWTDKFPELAEAAGKLAADSAVVDGEIVAVDAKGVSDFQALQNALSGGKQELAYYAFDLPYCGGYDLSRAPLTERKQLLEALLDASDVAPDIRYSKHIRGNGPDVLDNACRLGMEGIVSKRADSTYHQTRSKHWVKSKCLKRQEFVIVGYTKPSGSRVGFGALLLGYYDDDKLIYCGRVGTGFNDKTLRDLKARMAQIRVDSPPVNEPPDRRTARDAQWIRPELVAEVSFTEWTDDGMLRHPAFHGLREDKRPEQVVREKAAPVHEADHPKTPGTLKKESQKASRQPRSGKKKANTSSKASNDGRMSIAGVSLSNPDRVMYPDQGITKHELASFYETIADQIVPHVVDRPLALLRCPRGSRQKCFFQKHVSEGLPAGVLGLPIKESRKTRQTVYIKDLAGLIGLVQIGVLEIHLWGSPAKDVEKPDRIVFDLDPGPSVGWEAVVEGARRVRDVLDDLGLVSFLKTSGGKGLHVVVPVRPRRPWDQVKAFTKAVAERIADDDPDRYVVNMSKAKRKGRIFIDYLRNGRGATSVAPYSTRARAGAPVSTPVAWDELSSRLQPDAYTVENLRRRLAHLETDPWKGFFEQRQSITKKMLARVGFD